MIRCLNLPHFQQEQFSTLDWLDSYSKNLSTRGFIRIISSLRGNKHNKLEIVWIYCKCIDEKAAAEIARFLKTNNYLKRLEIADYSFEISVESV